MSNRDFERARKLYRGFREEEPKKVKRVVLPRTPRAVMSIGYLSAVEYDTTVSGKAVGYRHKFAAGSRPLLCTDGKRLFIIKGRYRVTARGIVDIDSRGREET